MRGYVLNVSAVYCVTLAVLCVLYMLYIWFLAGLSNTSVSTCHLPCSHGCVMTGKVYACRCSPGYQLAGDGISCVGRIMCITDTHTHIYGL